MPADAEPISDRTVQSGRGRWKIGAWILLIAVLAQVGFWIYFADDRTFSKMSILFVWPAALFLLAIWWTFFSAQPWSWRLGVWSVIVVAAGAFIGIFEFDATNGEMVPGLKYRWVPSAKQLAAIYLKNKPLPVLNPSETPATSSDEPWLALAQDWPGFRGAQRNGIVTGTKLRRDWMTRPLQEVWRHPIGLGWSAFTVVGEFAFTQEQRGPNECVVCYRVIDGTEVWVHADPVILSIVEINGDDGPHATPEFRDGKLYTLGGTGVLNCLEARTGQLHWQADVLKDAGTEQEPTKNLEWGLSGSPLIVDDLVIVSPGSSHDRATIAYHRHSGKIVWSAGTYQAGYASPHLATIHGVPQVIVFHGLGIAGHDLSTGKELWNYAWTNAPKVNSAQPVVFDDGSVVFGCGYGVGTARINLVSKTDGPWETQLRWKTNKFRPKFNDFITKAGYIYGLDDGILTCLDLESGKVKWKERAGQYGYGQLLLVDDLLLILSEEGELVLVEAVTDGLREIARQKVLDRICWNHLAMAGSKLLIRNNHTAACYDFE